MIFAPFSFRQSVSGIDPNAQAYLNEIITQGGTYTDSQGTAVNNLFVSLKSAGLYSKMVAMYPFVGGTANSHAINACNIGTHTITFFGGWTHNSSGITANGSTSYADTSVEMKTDIVFPDAHYSFRQTQTSPTNSGWDGYYESSTSTVFGCNLITGTELGLGLYYLAGSQGALTNYTDVMTGVRESTGTGVFYTNSTAFKTDSNNRSEFSVARNYFIGALNENGTANYYNTNKYNFYTLGTKILSSEISSWSTIWNTYITEMGR